MFYLDLFNLSVDIFKHLVIIRLRGLLRSGLYFIYRFIFLILLTDFHSRWGINNETKDWYYIIFR